MNPMNPPSPRPPGARIPLAWRNLTENKRRLAASLAGTAFAVALMFMENGFRNALLDSMVNVIDRFDCQLVVASRTLYTLSIPFSFPLRRVEQAKAIEGVVSGGPLYVETRRSFWRNPTTGLTHRVCVLAYPPEDDLLDLEPVRSQRDAWAPEGEAMADTRSRAEFFGGFAPGVVSELSGRTVRVVGTFAVGTNLQTDGNLVVSDRTLLKVFPDRLGATAGDRLVTLGLLRVRPGADVGRLRAAVEAALPPDVRVFTKEGFIAKERDFWDKVAPVGTVFLIGVVMGFIVGMVICYQVLFADITDRLGEFATLKAMGYSNLRLSRVVVAQAVYLALLGYALGLAVSLPLFGWVHEATGLPMDLKPGDSLAILGLTVVMCVLSGAYAARQVFATDPATLFQ
jgi:putative ABC transport system permease protein